MSHATNHVINWVVMSGVLGSLVAVVGTLLGSIVAHIFQRRTLERSERFTRERQLRDERLTACSTFASALVDYRRGQYDRWHRWNEEPEGAAHVAARAEAFLLRSAAYQALSRLQLITEDRDLLRLAEAAVEVTDKIHRAASEEEMLQELGARARQLLLDFVAAARTDLRTS